MEVWEHVFPSVVPVRLSVIVVVRFWESVRAGLLEVSVVVHVPYPSARDVQAAEEAEEVETLGEVGDGAEDAAGAGSLGGGNGEEGTTVEGHEGVVGS